jgi:hypothetical protein
MTAGPDDRADDYAPLEGAAPAHPFPIQTLHLTCVNCGYALRGLEPSGVCPECGTPIPVTILSSARGGWWASFRLRVMEHWSGPPLGEAEPRWLWRVTMGLLALPMAAVLLVAWHLRKQALDYWATVPDYGLLAVAASFAGSIWLVATPQRQRRDLRPARTDLTWSIVRRVLRALAFAPALAAALAIRSEYVPAYDHPAYARAGVLVLTTAPALSFLLFDYLAHLAARLPSFGLAVALRLVMHAATALGTLVALASLFGGREQRVPEYVNSTAGAFLDIGCCCGAGWVVGPVALALPVALAFRLMGFIRVAPRRR